MNFLENKKIFEKKKYLNKKKNYLLNYKYLNFKNLYKKKKCQEEQ